MEQITIEEAREHMDAIQGDAKLFMSYTDEQIQEVIDEIGPDEDVVRVWLFSM